MSFISFKSQRILIIYYDEVDSFFTAHTLSVLSTVSQRMRYAHVVHMVYTPTVRVHCALRTRCTYALYVRTFCQHTLLTKLCFVDTVRRTVYTKQLFVSNFCQQNLILTACTYVHTVRAYSTYSVCVQYAQCVRTTCTMYAYSAYGTCVLPGTTVVRPCLWLTQVLVIGVYSVNCVKCKGKERKGLVSHSLSNG